MRGDIGDGTQTWMLELIEEDAFTYEYAIYVTSLCEPATEIRLRMRSKCPTLPLMSNYGTPSEPKFYRHYILPHFRVQLDSISFQEEDTQHETTAKNLLIL